MVEGSTSTKEFLVIMLMKCEGSTSLEYNTLYQVSDNDFLLF